MAKSYPEAGLTNIVESFRVRLRDVVEFWFQRDWGGPSENTLWLEGQSQDIYWFK